MTSSIFTLKNLNVMYISIQALDPYVADSITQNTPKLDLIKLFHTKEDCLLKYKHNNYTSKIEANMLIIYKVFDIASKAKLQKQIKLILQDISQKQSNHYTYSTITQNYIKRFQSEYSRSIAPYLIGQNNYADPLWLRQLSFLNLFLLNQLSKPYGTYIILIYLCRNACNK